MGDDIIDNEGIICREAPHCPVCGAEGRALYQQLRDPLFGSPGVWGVNYCAGTSCGVGWVTPMPLPDSLPDLYRNYHTHAPEDGQADSVIAPLPHSPNRSALKAFLSRLLPWWRHLFEADLNHFGSLKPGSVLDVGCGSGLFLQRMIGAGWTATGIDFDKEAVSVARRVATAEVYAIDIFDPSLDERRFDGIMLDNVIEHLPDPAATIARCKHLLAPGGRLVMITPNFSALTHARYGQHWRGLETPRHLCLFNARSLKGLVRQAGFDDANVFTRPRMEELHFMIWASEQIMRGRAGEPKRMRLQYHVLKLRNILSALIGSARGEFLVCIAHRPEQSSFQKPAPA